MHVPPLRERLDDLPILVDYFVITAAREFNIDPPDYPGDLVQLLQRHAFPGNVRELKSMVFDAVGRCRSRTLSVDVFATALESDCTTPAAAPAGLSSSMKSLLNQLERLPTLKEMIPLIIEQALARAKGNQRIAALMLGITPQALSQRLKKRY